MTEDVRQSVLDSLRILDSDPEPFFDALTRAACAMAGMPIALISLVDGERQWFKSQVGLDGMRQTPRDISFCTWAIDSDAVFEIEDTTRDPRFSDNPLVVGAPNVRHYVGVPIQAGAGSRVGTLCLLSPEPGRLRPNEREALNGLAEAAARGMEQRAMLLTRMEEAVSLHARLQRSQAFLEQTNTAAKVGGWELSLATGELAWTRETHVLHGVQEGDAPSLRHALAFYLDEHARQLEEAMDACAATGSPIDLTLKTRPKDNREAWLHIVGRRITDAAGTRLIGAIQDVTAQRAALEALGQSEARYRRLFQHSMGLICTHTLEGVVTSLNPAASLSLGRPEAEVIGHSLAAIIPLEKRAQLQGYLARIVENQSDSGVMELVAEDGSRRFWMYHNVLDNEADPPYVLGHAQDITTQHLQEIQLQELAIRDPLTRCFNRRYLGELAHDPLSAWGCLVFDLDHFKEVNDQLGHAEGDAVLIAFVEFLSARLQPGEVVVRLGGDEFLVFVPGANLERLQALEASYAEHACQAPIRFSAGCAISRAAETVADTINRADLKLYERRRRERPAP